MIKKNVIIFGRGQYFEKKKSSIQNLYEIEAFIDNAVEEIEFDEETGKCIYNPREILHFPEVDILCVSTSWYQMWRQLINMGVEDYRIKFCTSMPPLQEGIEKIAFADAETLHSEEGELVYNSNYVGKVLIKSENDVKGLVRKIVAMRNHSLRQIVGLDVSPISRVFGSERGLAIDRYYIEKFLAKNESDIKGRVLEVLNNKYTRQFGGENVSESVVSHVLGWGDTILCNFETGEGVIDEEYDCIICTQTLQYIYNLESAIRSIYRMLKFGGVALITVPGIKPLCEYDSNHWGEFWSFTEASLNRLCNSVCNENDYIVQQYGNVKVATAYLYGVCVEEMRVCDLEYNDTQIPFLICARIVKK